MLQMVSTMKYSGLMLMVLGCVLPSSQVVIELEQVASHVTPCRIHHRANASSSRVVWMFAGEYLNISFCLEYPQNVSIHNFTHSNDGGSDVISILLDGIAIGEVTTIERSNMGAYWDEFLRSCQVGEWRELEAGNHTLSLTVTEADKFGVEVDAIVMEMDSVNVTADNIRCAGSTLMWGDNSGIGNGCNPSDELKTVKTKERGGVSPNPANAEVTTRLSVDGNMSEVTTRLSADVGKGKVTTRLSAGVRKGKVTTRMSADVDTGEVTTGKFADGGTGEVTTRLFTDENIGEVTTRVSADENIGDVTTRLSADENIGEVTTRLSADENIGEVTTRLFTNGDFSEVTTRLSADENIGEMTTRLFTNGDFGEVTTRLSADENIGEMTTRLFTNGDFGEVTTRLSADENIGEMTTRLFTNGDFGEVTTGVSADEDMIIIDLSSAPMPTDKLMTPPSLTSTSQRSNDLSIPNCSVRTLHGHGLIIFSHVIWSLIAFILSQIA